MLCTYSFLLSTTTTKGQYKLYGYVSMGNVRRVMLCLPLLFSDTIQHISNSKLFNNFPLTSFIFETRRIVVWRETEVFFQQNVLPFHLTLCWIDADIYFFNVRSLFGNLDMFLCHTGSCMTHIRLARELWRHNFKIKSVKVSGECSAHQLAADALLEQFGVYHKPRLFWVCRRMCASVRYKNRVCL